MMMSEAFEFEYNSLQEMLIVNHQEGFSYNICDEDDVYSIATKLNEQQARIEMLEKGILDCLLNNKSIGILAEEMELVE